MKIAESSINLTASHQSVQRHQQEEQLRYWENGRQPVEMNGRESQGRLHGLAVSLQARQRSVEVRISDTASSLQPKKALLTHERMQDMDEAMADLEVSLVKLLVERLTGRKIALFNPNELQPGTDGKPPADGQAATAPQATAEPGVGDRQGFGLAYDYYESHYEAESTRFSAEGLVRTADGREISIRADLQMSREFFSEERLSIRAGDALKDPLVINFGGNAAELTQREFSFDLDLDGRKDQIAFVKSGSGFLALDRNGNGQIDDGGELFGPTTGEGFAELAEFDTDGNQWIDENDPIYGQLRIWSKDSQGNDQLVGLGQRGVGAIYLGHVDTPFLLKDESNELLGQVRSGGLFLEEDGGVGTVQQVDLKV
jgi:hypothetical protein